MAKPFWAKGLVLDLETCAIDGAADYLEPVAAPANFRDPEKIAAHVSEKQAEALSRCALDPDLARIVALGHRLEGETHTDIVLCPTEDEERLALTAFWYQVALPQNRVRTLVTYNGFAFDLPVLLRRSRYLGVRPTRCLSTDRYRSPHIDLLQELTHRGQVRPTHSLRFYAKRLGFNGSPPDGGGAEIAGMVARGEWDAIRTHLLFDIEATYELAEWLGVFTHEADEEAAAHADPPF